MFPYFFCVSFCIKGTIAFERGKKFSEPNWELITNLYDLIEALENEENQ